MITEPAFSQRIGHVAHHLLEIIGTVAVGVGAAETGVEEPFESVGQAITIGVQIEEVSAGAEKAMIGDLRRTVLPVVAAEDRILG